MTIHFDSAISYGGALLFHRPFIRLIGQSSGTPYRPRTRIARFQNHNRTKLSDKAAQAAAELAAEEDTKDCCFVFVNAKTEQQAGALKVFPSGPLTLADVFSAETLPCLPFRASSFILRAARSFLER